MKKFYRSTGLPLDDKLNSSKGGLVMMRNNCVYMYVNERAFGLEETKEKVT